MERILELAKIAGIKAQSETRLSPQEKEFAELLIKKSAYIADINYNKGFGPVGQSILEHFGLDND